ncbi:hypothetical protein EBR21_12635 [bacterium]|nr:hypothetical protein [bacterium]
MKMLSSRLEILSDQGVRDLAMLNFGFGSDISNFFRAPNATSQVFPMNARPVNCRRFPRTFQAA